MIRALLLAFLASPLPAMAMAQAQDAGFDYWVLSLSWSPNWCALEGDARDSPQCDDDADLAWTLHGLWPQYDIGYPDWCRTRQQDPSRAETEAMADIMGEAGAARYQWQKHGSCASVSAAEYFRLSREAFEAVAFPADFARIPRTISLSASLVEEAFLAEDPRLAPDVVTVTCDEGHIQEVRICLDLDLEPRACGVDVRRDCTLGDALMEPVP